MVRCLGREVKMEYSNLKICNCFDDTLIIRLKVTHAERDMLYFDPHQFPYKSFLELPPYLFYYAHKNYSENYLENFINSVNKCLGRNIMDSDIKMENCGDTVMLKFGESNRTFITTKQYIRYNFIKNVLEETNNIDNIPVEWTDCKEVTDIEIKKEKR
jgi:hypothetical protein